MNEYYNKDGGDYWYYSNVDDSSKHYVRRKKPDYLLDGSIDRTSWKTQSYWHRNKIIVLKGLVWREEWIIKRHIELSGW